MKAIINANVFDGRNPVLKPHCTIVIENNMVKEITQEHVCTDTFEEVIDAKGKVVIPGLVDSHVHLFYVYNPDRMDSVTMEQIAVRQTVFAKEILMRGFTTVRDGGGCVYGLKTNIDEGFVPGPRIYPSYAMLTQTCGHGDCRPNRAQRRDANGVYCSPRMNLGDAVIADGVPEVLRAAREQLFMGASQIKIMASGGLLSPFDPLLGTQYTLEEMKAAVDVAKGYGTYVMAHIYTSEAMKQAAEAGVMCFEHATIMDEETARIIKDKGIWVSPQPQFPPNKDNNKLPPTKVAVREKIVAGEAFTTELINKYDLPILYGTDLLRDEANVNGPRQLRDLGAYKRRFGSYRGLVSATGNANEIIKMTTLMDAYPEGKIGVLESGSFADLLIVEGNPVEDLDVLCDVNNIKLIMKDAVVYKNEM